jgi:hypothetical protein
MLLTYPTKESLFRNLSEFTYDQSYLIIGNYKKLADWSLIPMRPMTVFLGPNSAGKSAVSDAIKVFKNLYGDESNDVLFEGDREVYEGPRVRYVDDPEVLPEIGFSFRYPKIKYLKGWLEDESMNVARPLIYELEDDQFPLLKKIIGDRNFLQKNRITMIVSTDDRVDIKVYLNNQLVSTWWAGASSQYITFEDIVFETIFKEDLVGINLREFELGLGSGMRFKFGQFPHFAYQHDWDYLAEDEDIDASKMRGAVISLLIIFYTIPIQEIHSKTAGYSTLDIREMPLGWVTPKLKESTDENSWLPTDWYDFSDSTELQRPVLKLIANQISCLIKTKKSYPGGYVKPDTNPNVLDTINHFLSHPTFLDASYKLAVDLKAIIPIEKLKKKVSLELEFQEYDNGIDFVGKVFLVDKEGRALDFDSVGAGYGQVCPILISLAFGDTILYKQPEVHLHPRLQSRLADCFVYSWNEQKKDFLIIETHSEHFVLRLLRRVRESFSDELLHTSLTLLPKDLGLIYFRPVGDKTSIYEIRVSADGQFLDAWPEGFFDDRDEDIWGPLN